MESVNDQACSILQNGFLQLRESLGDAIQWGGHFGPGSAVAGNDAWLTLKGKVLDVQCKMEIGPRQVEQLASKKKTRSNRIVVADYITPKAMEMLRAKGINYVDSKGNMYLRMQQVHIFINGIPNAPPPTRVRTRLVSKAGLQVVFWLLQSPSNVNIGYRALADRATVALGNLPMIIQALQDEGFLVKMDDKQWRLIDRERLLDLWVQEFGRRLKPAQLLGRFQASQADFRQRWKEMTLQGGAIWSGEPGADLLVNYLIPSEFTLYTNATHAEIIKNYRWSPLPTGNIAVYRKFWKDDPKLDEEAKPLLTYADLMESGDARGLEVAKMIYDKYLAQNE